LALGGAVTLHAFPTQLTAGKIVLCPIEFPWVLLTAAISETRMSPTIGVVTWKLMSWLYNQSVLSMVKLGRAAPES